MQPPLAEFERFAQSLSESIRGSAEDFLKRARALELAYRESVRSELEGSRKDLVQLADLLDEMRPRITAYHRQSAPRFNIYRFLRLERYERAFHTPMLAELLSPIASHGQERLFLESFLVQYCDTTAEESKHPAWYVLPEKEYIDLRIANEALRKAVFIENKVDTEGHSGQLSRYFKVWHERYVQGGCFAYLTIDGDRPPDAAFDESIFRRASIEEKLKLWSYKKNIAPWLDFVIDRIEAPVVKHMVIQYVDVLRNL